MAEEGSRATRRTVLRSGLLAIGGLAGIVGMAGLAEKVRAGAAVSLAPSGGNTIKVYGTEWRMSAPDLRRGDLPKRGDTVSVTGALKDATGEPAGAFFGTVLHLDANGGHGPFSTALQETHTFQLPGGNLVGMGVNAPDGERMYAIVGGTGRYSGVTGSYVGMQSPLDIGGDGTAEFTFTFSSGR